MIKILRYLKKKDWLYIFICLVFVVCQVYCDLTLPDYTSKLTSAVAGGTATMSTVWSNGGYMLLYALGSALCSIICGFFAARVAASFAKTLREELFTKVGTFSNAEMNRFSTPSLITRTTNDVVQMQNFIAMGMQVMIKAPVLAIWAICKISSTAIEWTVATIICVCVIVVVVVMLVAICYPKFKQIQKLTDELNDVTRENITGVRVIRAFNAENYQSEKFEKVNENVKHNQLFTARTMGLMMPVMTICMNGLTLAIYWIGAILINRAAAVPERVELLGTMTAFTQYALQVVMAFMMLITIFMMMPRCIVSARRIMEVLETEPTVPNGTLQEVVEPETESEQPLLQFKNVNFGYQKGANVLSDVNFTVNKGETVAFIGATGSGKTTIVNLIERYYDVTDGEILWNGVNIKEYDEETLRSQIALAPQKAVMFKGNIKDNVTYGCDGDMDGERMKKALQIAKADEFVYQLLNGAESDVAQGGTNFSGGQKQRLSIARAIYKNADLMIFDDTFSALDYKTDMQVRKGIKENLKGSTVLIVAQRIGTIMNADKIIVLDEGKVVGCGKHKELLETCPVYREIALSQLSKEEL
jgi:ATP-binding cassette subfamily B protein